MSLGRGTDIQRTAIALKKIMTPWRNTDFSAESGNGQKILGYIRPESAEASGPRTGSH